ncbi:hypothetical protein Hte_008817 [Hypoxylon texense]
MSSSHGFKIIIVGGGVAGLTLANMLERFNIDYVLLESHDKIIPPLGASIALAPNGLLVLDQLGAYDAIKAIAKDGIVDDVHILDKNGKTLSWENNVIGHYERRFGYPVLFFNRIWLLEALYEKLQHKDRILLGKRVVKIEHGQNEVKVMTKAGEAYTGSMVVGCDGIIVRTEMARIANEIQPGTFDVKEEDNIPCYYQCSFGIAHDVEQWAKHDTCFTAGDDYSFLVSSGAGNRVYWFFTVRLPEAKYGKDIPRYTKEDDERFLKKYAHLKIKENLTFGQLSAKRTSSTLTPLHEVVIKKWFYNRMVLMGDSCHKQNPFTGQGGNGAIESAAEFMNALLELRDSRPGGLKGASSEEVETIGRKMQDARHDRAQFLVGAAHARQALFAGENPTVSRLVLKGVLPYLGQSMALDEVIRRFTPGSRLNKLPVPFRPRQIPYDVELPAKPLRSAAASIPKLLLIVFMLSVLYITTKAWRIPLDDIGDWGGMGPLNRNWLGNNGFNDLLQKTVSAFAYQIFGVGPTSTLQVTYFMSQLVSPILIWTIEGYRSGNSATPLALPSLFLFAMQLYGIGQIAPLYAILSALFAGERNAGRWIPVEVAKALVPALTLGYIVPTVMMLTPTVNAKSWQDWTALWQFSPILFTAFTALFASAIKQWKRLVSPGVKQSPFDLYKDEDVPVLKSVYYYAFAIQAAAHISTLAYAYSHPAISFADLFWNLPSPFELQWSLPTIASQVAVFFKYDLAMAFTSIAVHSLYTIWTLRKCGFIKARQAVAPVLACILGQVLVGPGATMAGLWSWRESVIADLSTINRAAPPSVSKEELAAVPNGKAPNGKLSTQWQPSQIYDL